MGTKKRRQLPPDLVRGRSRFQAWRGQRKPGGRIPQPLWAMATRLAKVHGVSRTAAVRLTPCAFASRVAIAQSACGIRPPGFRCPRHA